MHPVESDETCQDFHDGFRDGRRIHNHKFPAHRVRPRSDLAHLKHTSRNLPRLDHRQRMEFVSDSLEDRIRFLADLDEFTDCPGIFKHPITDTVVFAHFHRDWHDWLISESVAFLYHFLYHTPARIVDKRSMKTSTCGFSAIRGGSS